MGVQDHQKGIRGEEWRVQLTESVKGQLTESVGVVDVDDDFSSSAKIILCVLSVLCV